MAMRWQSAKALIKRGRRLEIKGNVVGAAEAFERATTARQVRGVDNLFAALHLWILQSRTEDQEAAHTTFVLAGELNAGKRPGYSVGPSGGRSFELGLKIAGYWTEFAEPSRTALHRCIDIGDREHASHALLGLAGLELQTMEKMYGMVDTRDAVKSALRRVVELGHPDCAPVAADWLKR
jgi:hypothetical protein